MNTGLIRGSKAQAAMEFLMTYGWALLVVLVAIGALAFFGVLSPGQFLPDQCVLFAGVTCVSAFADANANELKFIFQNGLGYSMNKFSADIELTGVTAGTYLGPGLANSCVKPATGTSTISLVDGTQKNCDFAYNLNGDTELVQDDKVKGKIIMRWEDESGNIHTKTGDFSLTAEGP